MAEVVKRDAILSRLRERIAAKEAIIRFGAGCGMTAKCAQAGGADFISIYTTAICRIDGVPSALAWLPYGNVNEDMRVASRKILPLIQTVPCIAGLGVHDPRVHISKLIDEFVAMGYSGVCNEPFCSMYGPELCRLLEASGIGTEREVELIRTARERDIFSLAWAGDERDAARFADAGADVIGVLAGIPKEDFESGELYLSRSIRFVRSVAESARSARADVIVLAHGGPICDVGSARRAILEADVEGYATGSSGERTPAEAAVTEITREYKKLRCHI